MGVKPKQANDFSFHFTPFAMSGDWDRFWSAVYLVLEPYRDLSLETSFAFDRTTTNSRMKDAVLVVLCGLPGAGKTTLVKEIADHSCSASPPTSSVPNQRPRRYERLSFDDHFLHSVSGPDAFDPVLWKQCQREMVTRVKAWRQSQKLVAQSGGENQLVLLVDDTFQYRSLRKRFFHLASEVDCGFGILYVDAPVDLCRQRNATRSGPARVPDSVFQRMVDVFEAPDGEKHLFEQNTKSVSSSQDVASDGGNSRMEQVLADLVQHATDMLRERRRVSAEMAKSDRQRTQDQRRTHEDVVHRVDLQLRKWISSVLQQPAFFPAGSANPKAQMAQRLNRDRKEFLTRLKTQIKNEDNETSHDVGSTVASHVRCFQSQQQHGPH